MPAPRITPSEPWPVATCSPSRTAPTNGRSSGVSGRRPHHDECTRASAIAGASSIAACEQPAHDLLLGGSGVSQIWRVEPITIVRPSRWGCSSEPISLPGLAIAMTSAAVGRDGAPPSRSAACGPGASMRCVSRFGSSGHAHEPSAGARRWAGARPPARATGCDHGPAATIVVPASTTPSSVTTPRTTPSRVIASPRACSDGGSRRLVRPPRAASATVSAPGSSRWPDARATPPPRCG